MKIKEYKLLNIPLNRIHKLEEIVNHLIKEEFQPYGNLIPRDKGGYLQAMVKYED